MATAVLQKNQQVLLARGLDDGLLDDLWNFPSALGRSRGEAQALLKEKLCDALGNPLALKEPSHQLRHNITYRSIRVHVYKVPFAGKTPKAGFRWFRPQSIEQAAVSQLARKIARKLVGAGAKP